MAEEGVAELIARGDELMRRGNTDEAIEVYRRAFEMDQSYTRARDRVFTALKQRGDRARREEGALAARAFYLRAKQYYPADREIRDRLLEMEKELGETPAPPKPGMMYHAANIGVLFLGVELVWFGILDFANLFPMDIIPVQIIPLGLIIVIVAWMLNRKKIIGYFLSLFVVAAVFVGYEFGLVGGPPYFTDLSSFLTLLLLIWPTVPGYFWKMRKYERFERETLQ